MPASMKHPRVGILGGGQLGLMLVESANHHNIPITILDHPTAPAKLASLHDDHVTGSFSDADSVRALAEKCDIITAEIEHVDTHTLEEVQKNTDVKVEPSWQGIRVIQDKYEQKKHLGGAGVAQAEYVEVKGKAGEEGIREELESVGEKFGYPFMLKSRTLAYDGRGNYAVKSKNSIPNALEALKGRPLYAEKWADFRMELSVIVVKTSQGVLSYPTVETVQENSICKVVYAPPRNVPSSVSKAAQKLAKQAVATIEGKGCFAVEMFLNHDDSLLVCEIAPRVHNSGHLTIEACELSQFDAHLRAILDLPIPPESLEMQVPAAIMLNVLGGTRPDAHHRLEDCALSVPGARIHPYHKGDGRPGRKMGHITVTANSMYEAERRIKPLLNFDVNSNVPPRSAGIVPTPTPAGQPDQPIHFKRPSTSPVAVIMGSDSDLKTLVPGLKLLKEQFQILPEVEITSAHRTPLYMAQYCVSAARRGIKVIIAAAGGAAHLPGMAAAHTTLPVIGVPVKGSTLDGVDSLHSIVQMPRGVPVATVGINNSVNAALLAVRILGCEDDKIMKKVQDYAEAAKSENTEVKGPRLRDIGWEAYWEEMQRK